MNKFRNLHVKSIIFPTLIILVLAGFSHGILAQNYTAPVSAAELEQFRTDLDQTLEELGTSMEMFSRDPLLKDKITESDLYDARTTTNARRQLNEMTAQELEAIYLAFQTQFPNWRESSKSIFKIAKKTGANFAKASPDGPNNALIPDDCALAIGAAPSFADGAVAQGIVIAAAAAADIVPPVLNTPAVAIRAIAEAAALVLDTLNSQLDRCTGLDATAVTDIVNNAKTEIINNDNANTTNIVSNDNTNKGTILTSLDAKTTTITTAVTNAKTEIVNNDNTNRTLIVNNDNTNTTTLNTAITTAKTQIINNDNANTANIVTNDNTNRSLIITNDNVNTALLNTVVTTAKTEIINNDNTNTAFLNTAITNAKAEIINIVNTNAGMLRDLMLRTQIEADLAEADNATFVAFYVTPTSDGGHLDLVRQIVSETIAKLAGPNTVQANEFLAIADAAKANGDFKLAYRNYKKAYKKAVGI